MSSSESESESATVSGVSSRKKPKLGNVFQADKKLRNSTYETGNDCFWTHFKCFENVTDVERCALIKEFNNLADRNAQNSYLSGLISVKPVGLPTQCTSSFLFS